MESCQPILNTGLRGFKVATTRVGDVDGTAGRLIYRGYLVQDLAGKVSFEEVAYLLLYERLPKKTELENFKKQLVSERSVPPGLIAALETIPKDALSMDVLQAATALLAHHDPDAKEYSPEASH
ncbi:MAG: citrate (Si)-synthase, partial [Desulfobacterales bacterium]|nr:citrate (Si)-synthase [Desulfobacterales bacterium]